MRKLPHPPALPREAGVCGSRQMVETCLAAVLGMMQHADLSPRTQSAMLQLGVVACNQIKVSSVLSCFVRDLLSIHSLRHVYCTFFQETQHCEIVRII